MAITDTKARLRRANLRHADPDGPGIRRVRRGDDFLYLGVSGRVIRGAAVIRRIEALVIPPAWEQVWIAPAPNQHIQAVGRDAKGRRQYLYHTEWERLRDETKFYQQREFGKTLPRLRRRVRHDLRQRGFTREKVLACVVRLLDRTLIRIGNEEYEKENNSFGLTTLKRRHLQNHNGKLHFQFRGKSGKEQNVEVEDPAVERILKRLSELPGQRLFRYRDDSGDWRTIDSGDVNAYLRAVMGDPFSAKDFRTWGGSVAAVRFLADCVPDPAAAKNKKFCSQAIQQAACKLGNTVTICRDYYINPLVFDAFSDGRLARALERARHQGRPADLTLHERALLVLLSMPAPAKTRKAADKIPAAWR